MLKELQFLKYIEHCNFWIINDAMYIIVYIFVKGMSLGIHFVIKF